MKSICNDLAEEYEELDSMIRGLEPGGWQIETPFFGWTIKDEISHIAYFDRAARLSCTDADAFGHHLEELMKNFSSYDTLHDTINGVGGAMTEHELLEWWRNERNALIKSFQTVDPKTRLPWYGPSMSARSSATARLMETWAHGQDIADAIGVDREPSDRLKHIAHIGFSTFSWSFKNRGLTVPETEVFLELEGPDGENWAWGNHQAPDSVNGSALDFCLVVTQRRHVDDTGLITSGSTAGTWMEIAQAFAGPPETGPKPGERTLI